MAVKTRGALKEKFKKGSRPKEADFIDLIDSFVEIKSDDFVEKLPDADQSTRGVAQQASLLESKAGTNNSKFMTPKGTVALMNELSKKRIDKNEGKWLEAKLEKTTSNYGGSYQVTRFRLLSGTVQIEGVLKKGKAVKLPKDIFTLPIGYRPKKRLVFNTFGDRGPVRIDILTNGKVQCKNFDKEMTSLCGISFGLES